MVNGRMSALLVRRILREATHQSPCLHARPSSSLATPLYDFHVSRGGKMVDFAGYSMPVLYSDLGAIASHLHTRKNCSLFDVSHMLQSKVHGADRVEFMESLTVADVRGLGQGQGTLTVFTLPSGGIVDDLIVTQAGDYLYVVSNAGCREKDIPLMQTREKQMKDEGKDVTLELIKDMGLLALQGPTMTDCLQPLTSLPLRSLGFMTSALTQVAGIDCRVTRCGYTGEDGVELSCPAHQLTQLTEALLGSDGSPRLAGLGARDSLRLEAGLCLYGNDIDETTSPIEGGLAWTVAKARRTHGGFPGAEVILRQLKEGVTRRRVGLLSAGPPARGHTPVMDLEGRKVGEVTSGCPSPSLGKGVNVSMAYVEKGLTKVGTKLSLQVRGKSVEATVAKMPFVPTNYYSVK